MTFLSGESILTRLIYPAGAQRAQRCRMLGQQVYTIWDLKAPQLAPTAREPTSVRSH